jgi:hypothetical protein
MASIAIPPLGALLCDCADYRGTSFCQLALKKHQNKPMSENNHQKAAIEVWDAIPYEKRQTTTRTDFITAFTLGRVSMKACYDSAELLRVDDEPKPFTPEQTKN